MVDSQVSAHVVVGDAGMSGHGHMTVLELTWQRADPLAVRLSLTAEPDHPSLPRGHWVVLRDFLRYGVEEPTGDGAVRISPGDGREVVLELRGDAKPYTLRVPTDVVCDFLDATEVIVPTGTEAPDEVMDALIDRLLEY